MQQNVLRTISFASFALVVTLVVTLLSVWPALAADAKTKYPKMAPLDQYLMERNAEIALARTAAPPSISQDADVMVFGRHGYETAVKGKNGFVCIVERAWTSPSTEPDFWNPIQRAAICFNAPAARSYLPQTILKTNSILAGRSKAQMFEDLKTAIEKKTLPSPEPGSMCYMMSKQSHLNDRAGHWHPHLMFFLPPTEPALWGADVDGSPVISAPEVEGRVMVFMVPVGHWSDGTPDHTDH